MIGSQSRLAWRDTAFYQTLWLRTGPGAPSFATELFTQSRPKRSHETYGPTTAKDFKKNSEKLSELKSERVRQIGRFFGVAIYKDTYDIQFKGEHRLAHIIARHFRQRWEANEAASRVNERQGERAAYSDARRRNVENLS